jgi:hypothetical protein
MEMRYYGFSMFALGAKAVIDLVRGSAGLPDEPWDMARPVRPHRPRRKLLGRRDKRITFADFLEIAVGSFGWQINEGSCDVLDLGNGLRQAAVDGEVTLYGRADCRHMPPQYWDNYPLQPIPGEHLCSHWIDIASGLYEESFETRKMYAAGSGDHGAVGYADLWIDRKQAMRWLKRQGRDWRGRTDARQGGPQSMRQAIWEHLDAAEPPAEKRSDEPQALENNPAEPMALEDCTEPLRLKMLER